jgi:succinate dehydrogenase/fumarate reductase flavoprotein subunit
MPQATISSLRDLAGSLELARLMDRGIKAGKVTGAIYLDIRSGEIHVVSVRSTLFAIGRYEELWPFTEIE